MGGLIDSLRNTISDQYQRVKMHLTSDDEKKKKIEQQNLDEGSCPQRDELVKKLAYFKGSQALCMYAGYVELEMADRDYKTEKNKVFYWLFKNSTAQNDKSKNAPLIIYMNGRSGIYNL